MQKYRMSRMTMLMLQTTNDAYASISCLLFQALTYCVPPSPIHSEISIYFRATANGGWSLPLSSNSYLVGQNGQFEVCIVFGQRIDSNMCKFSLLPFCGLSALVFRSTIGELAEISVTRSGIPVIWYVVLWCHLKRTYGI